MLRPLLRRAALALALVAAGGQFFSVSHLLFVPHTVCAEHGELIHLDSRHAVHAQDVRSAYRATEGAETADPHDHCLISALRKQAFAIPPALRVPLPPHATQRLVISPSDSVLPRAVAVLHLAPKSSPPA